MDIDTFLQPLAITTKKLSQLTLEFEKTFRYLASHSLDQFLATPVSLLPCGSEKGQYLAIDVGGTNLRCAILEFSGEKASDHGINILHQKSWPIDQHLKAEQQEELFAWIGDCIAEVIVVCLQQLARREEADFILPVGITFSFPMIQKSIAKATLMPMGKGFAVENELDLGRLVLQGYEHHVRYSTYPSQTQACIDGQDSLNAALPALRIIAIANDTVATFASLGYETQSSPKETLAIGLVVGTGVNAAIPMKLEELHESKQASIILHEPDGNTNQSIIVNTELSVKGTAEPLRRLAIITQWDEELDRYCSAPGFQPLEYMTGGRYLGEVVRLIVYDYFVVKMHVNPVDLPKALVRKDGISTEFLAIVVAAVDCTATLLDRLNVKLPVPPGSPWKWTVEGTMLFRKASRKIRRRAAGIIAAATVALLACSGQLKLRSDDKAVPRLFKDKIQIKQDLIVAYTGSTIAKYPGFLYGVQTYVDELISLLAINAQSNRVIFREAKDGGIIGAGILAATLWNLDTRNSAAK